ncbi:MAG TPA: L,D-transpeptidase [Acidimicrobiia bacterium]|nr:L,D-transpeptidase [Acidimicrobiia bacterium]
MTDDGMTGDGMTAPRTIRCASAAEVMTDVRALLRVPTTTSPVALAPFRPDPDVEIDSGLGGDHRRRWVAPRREPNPIEEPPTDVAVPPSPRPDPEPDPALNERPPGPRRRHIRGALAMVVTFLIMAGGVSVWWLRGHDTTGEIADAPPADAYAMSGHDQFTSLVAHAARADVDVYASPDQRAPSARLRNPTDTGSPLVFLVVDATDEEWLRVRMPVPPNGATGWVRRDGVTIRSTRYRVRVALGAHRLELYRGSEFVFSAPVAIGTADTPTPGGQFYIKDLVQPPSPDTGYGPYVFGLSGYSNRVEKFTNGAGVIGIHGTNEPQLIGRDVSRGCIRLRNEDLKRLVGVLPLGTPVDIVA